MTRAAKWYAALIVLGLVLVAGVARVGPRVTAPDLAKDREADSLRLVIADRDQVIAAGQIELAHLSAKADSATVALTRVLVKPRTAITATPDTAPHADTVKRTLVMRAEDVVPFSVPTFLVEALAEAEARTALAVAAWQASEKARLFADSVVIPDLRRQHEDAGRALRLERERIAERDQIITQQARALKVEKAKGKLATVAVVVLAVVAVAR